MYRFKTNIFLTLYFSIVIILTSCGTIKSNPIPSSTPTPIVNEQNNPKADDENQNGQSIDYNKIKPNELGQVMILMYHNFGDIEKDVWWRSYYNFRKDLALLYDRGYRLISMEDFLANNINIPAGTTPVIFTFDDGTNGQFNLIEEAGKLVVNPHSAMGIMEEFYQQHPDFGLEATFYINEVAFAGSKGSEKERLQYLLDKGMGIGNHTFGHINLGKANTESIQKAIGSHVGKVNQYFPGYNHQTLALPFGAYAKATFDYIVKGQYEDIRYENKAIMLVGSNPSPAPAHIDYYPLKMPRIRASEGEMQDMYYYLEYFEKNQSMRYISDGDKNTLCFPESDKEKLSLNAIGNKEVIMY